MAASRPLPTLTVLALAAFLGAALPVSGNHTQAESGRTVAFDHRSGNEWWVEVLLAGADAATASKVEAMDTNGPWVTLQKKSWGPYAGSFHIEPGHQVRFRATWPDGDVVTSCWFTHPAGAEQCGTPPSPWQTTHIADAGLFSWSGDMAISDVDNDGRRDVTVATSRGLRVLEWTGSAWTTELLTSLDLGGVAAGDGDGDGRNEIYALRHGRPDGQAGTTLHRFAKTSSGWQDTMLFSYTQPAVGDMTLGSIDGVAGPELYLGLYGTWCDPEAPGYCISNSTVHHVAFNGDFWESRVAAELGGHIDSLWVGDGDNTGTFELYVGHGTRHADRTTQVQRQQGQWVVSGLPGYGSDSGMALAVAGDGDRDGRNEVYSANWYGAIWKSSHDPAQGWTQTFLTTSSGYNPISLFLGDADSDGTQELYMTTSGGDLVQVRWSGSAWTFTKIADPQLAGHEGQHAFLVVGDGDGDAQREAYIAVAFLPTDSGGNWDTGAMKAYKVAVPRATGFDATFTGVRGNEWWQQVSVSVAGGTLANVEVRLNGGAWQPMSRQSYGWTSSIRAVEGTIVQFRAMSTAGATDLSDCYRWIPPANTDASKVACSGTPPPTFDATFSGVKGNEWWVQASVSANEPLAGVDARVGCSATWKPLTKQSYGWAASFHVPDGSKVDFRARSTSGATDLSGGYIWPSATPTSAC